MVLCRHLAGPVLLPVWETGGVRESKCNFLLFLQEKIHVCENAIADTCSSTAVWFR